MPHASPPLTALVLAGKRDGLLDPLAAAEGLSHKCLVPVHGRAMLEHPAEALALSPIVGRVIISIDDPNAVQRLPRIASLIEAGKVEIVLARNNLVDSVLFAAESASFPLLITTADNVLLTPEAVADFDRAARAQEAEAAVAFARREAVLAAHPEGQRRFYRFSCGAYSNCNLYWIQSRRALASAEVFRTGGQFAKHPLRIIGAFGLLNLLRFRFGIGTLEAGFRRFSKRFNLAIRPVQLADGRVAIDVDNLRTKAVVEEILSREAFPA